MSRGYGGFKIAAGVTSLNCPNAGVKLTSTNVPTLAAVSVSKHGDQSVSEAASTGRLTLKPGVYDIRASLTIEGEYTSGTSGDSVGVITGQLYQAGSAVAGTKGKVHTQAEGQAVVLSFGGIVEITEAQRLAGTNYVEFYLFGGDANGNDVIPSEGQITAKRLDD